MKIIKQIFIILLFYILGEIISFFIKSIIPSIYIPGSIIGMLLLLFVLITKKIRIKHVNEVGSFLSNNMAFFFIPAAVSVIEYYDILKTTFFKIIMIIIMSSIISFIIISYIVKITIHIQNKYEKRRK